MNTEPVGESCQTFVSAQSRPAPLRALATGAAALYDGRGAEPGAPDSPCGVVRQCAPVTRPAAE